MWLWNILNYNTMPDTFQWTLGFILPSANLPWNWNSVELSNIYLKTPLSKDVLHTAIGVWRQKWDTWRFYFLCEVQGQCYPLQMYLGWLCCLSGCYDTRGRGEQWVSGEVIISKCSLLFFFFSVICSRLRETCLGLLKFRSNTVYQNRIFFIFIWYQGIPDFSRFSIMICLEAEREH